MGVSEYAALAILFAFQPAFTSLGSPWWVYVGVLVYGLALIFIDMIATAELGFFAVLGFDFIAWAIHEWWALGLVTGIYGLSLYLRWKNQDL